MRKLKSKSGRVAIESDTTMSAKMPSETDLVDSAKSGDRQAFERLYRRHVETIYSLAWRLCGRREDAEDLTQEAFVKAWQALDSFRATSSFATWIHRITVNLAMDRFRKTSRRDAMADDLDHVSSTGRSRSHGGSLQMDLERAIGNLPDGARHVFVLYEMEGLSHREIASAMQIATGTSKAQLYRARNLLREALGE